MKDVENQLQSHLKNRTVLLVEDNEMNLEMLTRRLSRAGFNVLGARSGEESLEIMKNNKMDIILMDISMPGIGGIETTKRIKNNSITTNIPIIALTAKVMPGDKEITFLAGCDDYETKPIRINRLINKIDSLLENR